MLPQHQQDTCERQDLKIEPHSCFSDFSDSLNLMKVPLHLEKKSNGLLVISGAFINEAYFPVLVLVGIVGNLLSFLVRFLVSVTSYFKTFGLDSRLGKPKSFV